MSGWIRVDRAIFDGHPMFKPEPMSEREAWLWMIQNAAWEDTRHRVGAAVLDVPRGSFMATLRELQSVFMWATDTRVRGFLKRLENERMIERTTAGATNARKTHVTICNYDKFQSPERADNAPRTHEERTENAVKKQINNKQSLGADAPSAKTKASRLPADWQLPRDWGLWAVAQGMDELSARREADRFRDYWISVSGRTASKLDWQATWRNWVRKSLDDRKGGSRAGQPQLGEARQRGGHTEEYNGQHWERVYA